MAVYFATKAFVLSFTEALHEEMARHGIKVSALCPGPTATGFQGEAGLGNVPLFRFFPMMSARRVAEARQQILASTETLLRDERRLSPSAVASVIRQARSRLDVTLSRLLD